MADNVAITAGTGTTVATDERTINAVAGHVQRVAPHGTPAATPLQTTVTNTSTSIIAAKDTQHTVIIINYQTVPIYINDGTATTGHFRIDPGASVTLFTSAAIEGITSAAYTASGDAKVHTWQNHE